MLNILEATTATPMNGANSVTADDNKMSQQCVYVPVSVQWQPLTTWLLTVTVSDYHKWVIKENQYNYVTQLRLNLTSLKKKTPKRSLKVLTADLFDNTW